MANPYLPDGTRDNDPRAPWNTPDHHPDCNTEHTDALTAIGVEFVECNCDELIDNMAYDAADPYA